MSKVFQAKDYVKAVEFKERVCGVLIRDIHPTMGVIYEVKFLDFELKIEGKKG